jgi:Putative prokaryotic signal transducing protein
VTDEDLIEVYRGGGGEPVAQILRSVLEGAGIECLVTGSWGGSQYPINAGPMGEFALVVRAEDADRARAALADHT